jgi:hypothetical protein
VAFSSACAAAPCAAPPVCLAANQRPPTHTFRTPPKTPKTPKATAGASTCRTCFSPAARAARARACRRQTPAARHTRASTRRRARSDTVFSVVFWALALALCFLFAFLLKAGRERGRCGGGVWRHSVCVRSARAKGKKQAGIKPRARMRRRRRRRRRRLPARPSATTTTRPAQRLEFLRPCAHARWSLSVVVVETAAGGGDRSGHERQPHLLTKMACVILDDDDARRDAFYNVCKRPVQLCVPPAFFLCPL